METGNNLAKWDCEAWECESDIRRDDCDPFGANRFSFRWERFNFPLWIIVVVWSRIYSTALLSGRQTSILKRERRIDGTTNINS